MVRADKKVLKGYLLVPKIGNFFIEIRTWILNHRIPGIQTLGLATQMSNYLGLPFNGGILRRFKNVSSYKILFK